MNRAREPKPQGDSPMSFAAITITVQCIVLILFATVVDYDNADRNENTGDALTDAENRVTWFYPMYQDIHVMIFIGFGFLMTFLHKYAWSSVSYTLFISALTIQMAIIIVNFFHMLVHDPDNMKIIKITIEDLIAGDFACGAVLISFGAVLGRLTPTQLIVMAIFELLFYAVNEAICVEIVQAIDMGGSMYVHSFGAYFGLAVSLSLGVPANGPKVVQNNESSYTSDLFAMIGTIFLWMFWPSFNGAFAEEKYFAKERVVLNTVLALCGSCVMAYATSRLMNKKFDMVHIQNATLAGGVAVGSSSDLVVGPWAGILIGMVAGFVSVGGYVFITPCLERTFGILDTCGVHNLHGLPGIIGGIGGAISAAAAGDKAYGTNIAQFWPARDHRSASGQGGYQALALVSSLCFSIVGGLITGCILGSPMFNQEQNAWHDKSHWELASDDEEKELLDVTKTEIVDGEM